MEPQQYQCAEESEAWGAECARDMRARCQACAPACRRCADECRRMASAPNVANPSL